MKLDALLTESEMAEFGELVQQATDSGAQAVRFWSEARGLIVIGLVSAGQLETWFASPAKSTAQAIAVQQKSATLVLNPVVCAEIARAFDHDWAKLDAWRRAAGIELETLPFEASVVAANAHAQYRKNGGQRIATLPDFFIGAHALCCGHALLTRDATRYKTYFPKLKIISP